MKMEVSNEIKEDIRKTQSELKNAIRAHQIWVSRLQDNENDKVLKIKVREAEKEIIAIGQSQKRVVNRLRRELELYQQRLQERNKQVNIENDTRYIAQQLRDHQIQFKSKNRSVSLLKPSVLNEIQIKSESNNGDRKQTINDLSDSENEIKSSNEKENSGSTHSENEEKDLFSRDYDFPTATLVHDRNNYVKSMNKVKESMVNTDQQDGGKWQDDRHRSDSDSLPPDNNEMSPSPSPPPLPDTGEQVSQEIFLRFVGLVTHHQKEIMEKKLNERRKRSITSTNKNDYLYGNFDPMPKRKKYNQFPYLQSHSDPPQTRSAKLRKQQKQSEKSSREGSPSGSSSENKGYLSNKPSWPPNLPAGITLEPIYSPNKKVCHGCGRNDVPSLLVRCSCGVHLHTGCGLDGQCTNCQANLPDPTHCVSSPPHEAQIYRDKLAERKRLQEKNIQLCIELRKLEARAATLKENLDDHHTEKRQLLADQIKTQRGLQKLLDFISQFKETSISIRSTSISDTGSEISKSNDE